MIVKSFIINRFLKYQKAEGEIIFKMGMLIPIFEHDVTSNSEEQAVSIV